MVPCLTPPPSAATDSLSVLLRLLLREPGALEELRSCEALVSSELLAAGPLRRAADANTVLAAAGVLGSRHGWLA